MNVIIPYSEIHEILNGSYIDDGEETLTRSCLKNRTCTKSNYSDQVESFLMLLYVKESPLYQRSKREEMPWSISFFVEVVKKEKIVPENKNQIEIYSLNYSICNEIYDLDSENWN